METIPKELEKQIALVLSNHCYRESPTTHDSYTGGDVSYDIDMISAIDGFHVYLDGIVKYDVVYYRPATYIDPEESEWSEDGYFDGEIAIWVGDVELFRNNSYLLNV